MTRQLKPAEGTLVDRAVLLCLSWTATGSSSNPTLTANQKKMGLKSINRTAAGKWDLVLDDTYHALKGASVGAFLTATGSASGVAEGNVYAFNCTASGGMTLSVFVELNGTLSDLASGDTITVELRLSRSSLES